MAFRFVGHVMSQHQAAMVGCHNGVKVTSCDGVCDCSILGVATVIIEILVIKLITKV